MGLMIITGYGIEDAEGAGTPIWEPNGYNINYNAMQSNSAGSARGPNNIVYRVWIDTGMALMVSYTDDNGSTYPWSSTQIIDSAWKGHTNLIMGGICVLANNTVLVHFIANDADDVYNTYIACRWNWSGDWDIIKVYGSGLNDLSRPKMAVNETKVLMTYYLSGHIRYKIFDPSDSSVDPIAANLPTQWHPAYDSQAWNYNICVNQSGLFIIATNGWTGSFYRFYIRDLEGIHGVIYCQEPWGLYLPYGVHIVCTSDDLFALGMVMTAGAGSNFWILHFYESTPWSGFSYRVIESSTADKDIYSLGVSLDVNDYLTYYFSNGTGSGEQVEISKTTALIDATEATWETNIINAVYDYGTHDDKWYSHGWYNGKYPIVEGHSVCIPLTGWIGEHVYKDELGSPDNYSFALYWNATFYWYEYNLPPEFSDEFPTNTTTGVVLQPWCHVTIEDPDGDAFNVTWYENSTSSWVQRQQNLTASNGTFWWRFTQASSYSTTYYWKVVANDTNGNENTTIYHFTTLGNTPPVGSSPFPSNGSSGITPTPTCRITVSDANGDPMDISWLENTTGDWVERHDDSGVSNGVFSFQFTQFSAYSTTYYWRINLTDGTDNVTYIFHFTIMDNLAPTISFPSPGNGSTSSPSPTTSITVGDIDSMDVDWLEWTGGIWVLRQRSTGISSGAYTWVFSGATEDDETYYWAVNATDGSLNTTEVYHFTVETVVPTEEDEGWNLETLDYGMFIGLAFLIIVVIIAGLGAIIRYSRDDA